MLPYKISICRSHDDFRSFYSHAWLGAWIGLWAGVVNTVLGSIPRQVYGVGGHRRNFDTLKEALCEAWARLARPVPGCPAWRLAGVGNETIQVYQNTPSFRTAIPTVWSSECARSRPSPSCSVAMQGRDWLHQGFGRAEPLLQLQPFYAKLVQTTTCQAPLSECPVQITRIAAGSCQNLH